MLATNNELLAQVFGPRTRIDADGTVEGYASLFGAVDQARDMVMPGAFRETLRLRGVSRVPMLFQHDPAEPVGVWLELREDARGLFARGRLIPEVARGRELLALLRAGAIDGLSIGFRTVRGRVDPRNRIRMLEQVDLWEISIVTFPLLAGARVRAVKNGLPSRPVSSARTRAERDWKTVSCLGTAQVDALAQAPVRAPRAQRLEVVHARRIGPPRRERTLFKVQRLRSPDTRNAGPDDFDDMPRDIDEFRRTLAHRIEAFVRSRTDGAVPSAGEAADASPAR